MDIQDIQTAFDDNTLLAISESEQVGLDCVKITSCAGPVFFVRLSFLCITPAENLVSGFKADFEQTEDILNAALAFACERKAEDYLARCEQCRSGLEKKLFVKGFSKDSIKTALDYLEGRNLLSDARYCQSWLKYHGEVKKYGRTRLFNELMAKGISRSICNEVLDQFFENHSEADYCQFRYEKGISSGKSGEKLIKYLIDSGFSYKLIKETVKNQREK